MDASVHHLQVDPSTDDEGRHVLALSGDVDLKTVPALTERILDLASPGQTIVLDLAGVRFVDSPGLGSLIHCHLRVADAGGTLVLRAPQAPVRELFDLVQLGALLDIEPEQPA